MLSLPSTICLSNSFSILSGVTALEAEPLPVQLLTVCDPEAKPSPTPTPTPTLNADISMLFCSIFNSTPQFSLQENQKLETKQTTKNKTESFCFDNRFTVKWTKHVEMENVKTETSILFFFFSVGNRTMKKEKGSINRFTVKWKTHKERKSTFHSETEQRKRIYNRLEFSLINGYINYQSL